MSEARGLSRGTIPRLLDGYERLLEQNSRLIEALVANQPVEVIRAMNPVVPQPVRFVEPWSEDRQRDPEPRDLWGDEDVTNEELLARGTGWVTPLQAEANGHMPGVTAGEHVLPAGESPLDFPAEVADEG